MDAASKACGWNQFCPIYNEYIHQIEDSADSAAAQLIKGDMLGQGSITTSSIIIIQNAVLAAGDLAGMELETSLLGMDSDCFLARADINEDGEVGIEDLTLAIYLSVNGEQADP